MWANGRAWGRGDDLVRNRAERRQSGARLGDMGGDWARDRAETGLLPGGLGAVLGGDWPIVIGTSYCLLPNYKLQRHLAIIIQLILLITSLPFLLPFRLPFFSPFLSISTLFCPSSTVSLGQSSLVARCG